VHFVAVLTFPLVVFLDDFLAAVRAAQIHYLVIVEDGLHVATDLEELGLLSRIVAH